MVRIPLNTYINIHIALILGFSFHKWAILNAALFSLSVSFKMLQTALYTRRYVQHWRVGHKYHWISLNSQVIEKITKHLTQRKVVSTKPEMKWLPFDTTNWMLLHNSQFWSFINMLLSVKINIKTEFNKQIESDWCDS